MIGLGRRSVPRGISANINPKSTQHHLVRKTYVNKKTHTHTHTQKKRQQHGEVFIPFGTMSDLFRNVGFWQKFQKIRQNFRHKLLVFFAIFGGVMRTAAKNRKKCLVET